MKNKEIALKKWEMIKDMNEALITGLLKGDEMYEKVYDRAIAIRVVLDNMGLKIIRKPRRG